MMVKALILGLFLGLSGLGLALAKPKIKVFCGFFDQPL